jgi:hypothetical protein
VNLHELNTRWQETGHPFAMGESEEYQAYCPKCEHHGSALSLTGAMSAALTHKKDCPALE